MTSDDRSLKSNRYVDKWLFLIVFAIGLLVIGFVDQLNASKWAAVIGCVCLMLGYVFAAWQLAGLKLRPDQIADNSYYLGLLYTLTSLGFALIRFTSSEQATEAILSNFGIAIFTTIMGLGLRVFIGQFREDPEDLEYEAKVALSDSVTRMRRELDVSVAELRSFADGMRQVVAEFAEKANKSSASALERSVAQFEKAVGTIGERFERSSETFTSRLASFDGSLERVVIAVESLVERIGAVRADSDMLDQALRPALQSVEQAVAQFAESVSHRKAAFEDGSSAVLKIAASVDALNNASATIQSAASGIGDAAARLGDASSAFVRLDEAASSAAASTSAYMERLAAIAAQAEARHVDLVERVSKVAETASAESAARLRALEVAASRVVETLDRLDREFAGTGDTVQRVRRELTELAGWMIERLER